MLRHIREGTFENIFEPVSKLLARYGRATVAIDVVKGLDQYRGTGFIVQTGITDIPYLVTAKHNVDPEEGVEIVESFVAASGDKLRTGAFYLSPRYDIAVFPLLSEARFPLFALREETAVFDEVFSIGFPFIPRARSSGLLGHRGEVNGHVELYSPEGCPAIIISNMVSAGNSGGPVLDRFGRCVGMTINWLEAEYGNEKARFSAAIPALSILDAIAEAQ